MAPVVLTNLCTWVQALLSLGASPDYKDRRGLTPLYHTVLTGGETSCCETLLYHHAKLGIRDENGWDETHQVHVSACVHVRLSFVLYTGSTAESLQIILPCVVCSCARTCIRIRTHSCHDSLHLSCLVSDTFHP